MNLDIKESIYDILANQLGYNVIDNPYSRENNKIFPCVFLKTSNINRDIFGGNIIYNIEFTVDIFSNYNGEKEILEMEEEIANKLIDLYKEYPEITYIKQRNVVILDEKNTGAVRKHGNIKYNIVMNGMMEGE